MDELKKSEAMPADVSYIVHEGAMARSERMIKRLFIALVISLLLLFASNMIWLYEWSRYDTISYQQDGYGLNNICTGTQGNITNEPEAKNANTKEP